MSLPGYDDWKTTPPPDVDLAEIHGLARQHVRHWAEDARDMLRMVLDEYSYVLRKHLNDWTDERPPHELVEAAELLDGWMDGKGQT